MTTRVWLCLFGACLFASSLEIVLHESGHALAARVLGADVDRFDVHPFRRSEVTISYDGGRRSETSLLFSSAGILFAVGVSTIAFLVAFLLRSHFFLPLSFLLPVSLFAEGGYLIDGSLNDYGDPSEIASLAYCPRGILIGLGGLMVVGALLLTVWLIARVGVAERAAWWTRSVAFLAVASVTLPNGLYAVEAQDSSIKVITVLALGFGVLLFISISLGLIVHALRGKLSGLLGMSGDPVWWSHAAAALVSGLTVVGVMLAFANR